MRKMVKQMRLGKEKRKSVSLRLSKAVSKNVDYVQRQNLVSYADNLYNFYVVQSYMVFQ